MSYRDAVMAAKYAGGPDEQATTLHEERLETVATGGGSFGFDQPRALVVHVVPDQVYDDGYAVDLSEHGVLPEANPERPAELPVVGVQFGDDAAARGTWTANGFGAVVERDGAPTGYAHLFSNGVVEAVSALPFTTGGEKSDAGDVRLDGRRLELALTRCVRRYLRLLAFHQQRAPLHVAVSAYGVEGHLFTTGDDATVDGTEVDTDAHELRGDVIAPFPVVVDNFDADVRATLADPIDALWRASGRPGSPFFDDGDWALRSAFESSY